MRRFLNACNLLARKQNENFSSLFLEVSNYGQKISIGFRLNNRRAKFRTSIIEVYQVKKGNECEF